MRSTLNSVNLALILAAGITTLLGIVLGAIAASRAVRPLTAASQAAQAIAGGRLDTRLAETEDPDLAVLTSSFNDMASALQLRVERDTRFTSDVSHELRSPLMTLAASVEVMQARRDEMPERAQAALDLLVADVARFQGLVEDLLEISRFDAGGIRLNVDELLVGEFVRQAVAISSAPDTRILVAEIAEEMMIKGDRRRLARVVANLIDNGRAYGGGELEISVFVPDDEDPPSQIWITVEDHGPGVPQDERDLIFERFARGSIAGRRSGSEGAGLGLALVDEHIKRGAAPVRSGAEGEQAGGPSDRRPSRGISAERIRKPDRIGRWGRHDHADGRVLEDVGRGGEGGQLRGERRKEDPGPVEQSPGLEPLEAEQ